MQFDVHEQTEESSAGGEFRYGFVWAAVSCATACSCAVALQPGWMLRCDEPKQQCWGAHPEQILFQGTAVFKKFQSGGRGAREAECLEQLSALPEWRPFTPRFNGLTTDSNGEEWISMENLTAGMKSPVVLDVKIGTRNYGPDASPEKKEKQKKKAVKRSTTSQLGLCIVGCSIPGEGYDMASAEQCGNRPGRLVSAEELPVVLQRFLVTEARLKHARYFVAALLGLFQAQADYVFFGSSLLFAYDAALGDNAQVRIAMVDFCHMHTMEEMRAEAREEGRESMFVPRDFSYIYGLTNLLDIFDNILFRRQPVGRGEVAPPVLPPK